jgi:hypothetical protein
MTAPGRLPVLLLIGAVLLVAGCLGPPTENDPSLRHTYWYGVTIGVDRVVDDLVLRLPLPSVNGSSAIGEAMANGEGYGLRPGWNFSVVEANGTPLLELRAARFVPEYRGTPIAILPGETPAVTPPPAATGPSEATPSLMPYSFGVSIAANRTIQTGEPAGQEPLLGGGGALTPEGCGLPGQGEGVRCYRHPVEAFADYRADAPANVSIGVGLVGSNEWWRGGWTFNSYRDEVLIEFRPGERGWVTADARLTAGEGVYP